MTRGWWLALAGATQLACVDVGVEEISIPLYVAGTAIEQTIVGKGGALIELEAAQLAFGPLYLCAGAQAGELCETAKLEWLDATVVDALDPSPAAAGTLVGLAGSVRSWMFDLGLVSLLTQTDPLVLPAAEQLGEASVRLVGRATIDGVTIPFRVAVAVQQEEQTEQGVPVVRKSSSDPFDYVVSPGEPGLLVRFDPSEWVTQIDFAGLLEDAVCEPGGAAVVCAGQIEQRCDAAGELVESRDCAALGEVCVRAVGCVAELELDAESQGYRAVRNQLVAGARPEFRWGFSG